MSPRSKTRARRTLVCWLCVLTVAATSALADEQARVLIYPPEGTDALLEEALIRISGELGAVGLRVEVRPPGTLPEEGLVPLQEGDYGAIVLSQQRSRIDIRAFAPGLETPVSQSAQRGHPGMDAEVIAVRAVEALRAAMIQYARYEVEARRQSSERAVLPDAVTDFTRITPLAETPAEPEARPEPEPDSGPPGSPPRPESIPAWSVWIGGLGQVDLPAGRGQGGVHGALWWQPSWLRFGLSVQHGFLGGRYEAQEGLAEVQRTSWQLLLGAESHPWPGGILFVAGGPGAVHYAARAEARAGFAAGSGTHWSPAFGLQAGVAHWLTSRLGLYASFGGELLTDALRLRFDQRDVAVAGRPTLSMTAGLTLGF